MKKNNLSRYTLAVVFILVTALMSSGCAQMRDKFIRKPKGDKERQKNFYAVRKYGEQPTIELYTKRYIFWKNWHTELLSVIDNTNHKKKVVAIEQGISNLMDMRNMLVDEKAAELQELIDKMAKVEATIKKEKITTGNRSRIVRKVESLAKQIRINFSYNKMEGFIRDDFAKK